MVGCKGCRGSDQGFAIEMAFQPIVDVVTGKVFAYEALVRGTAGESAGSVLERVTPENLYAFDQKCRVAAIEGAVNAGILKNEAKLSINFLPNAVYSPLACIQLTLRTASATGFPVERLIFEFTENEKMVDTNHVRTIVECYNQMGFGTAIDDFGAGHAGLNLLSALTTDYLKLDMEMIRGIDTKKRNRVIVEGIVDIASRLGVTLIAEGIETVEEYRALREMGVRLFQGYLFAAPAFKALPDIALPDRIVTRAA